jgi:hypothetical protein
MDSILGNSFNLVNVKGIHDMDDPQVRSMGAWGVR